MRRHRNVVALYGSCVEKTAGRPSRFSLVLELLPGGSLLERLSPLSAAAALTALQRFVIASDVARGLHYLHVEMSPPLIHQDVKSDNVLLTEASGRIVAKVADFGTARVVRADVLQSHHSTRLVVGTTPYQPGEYLQQGHVSEKTDTYAYGVVLLELLTGRPPFDAESKELLSYAMAPMLREPEQLLPSLLDGRAAGWPRLSALVLARIAARCAEPVVRERCTVRAVLSEVEATAASAHAEAGGSDSEDDEEPLGAGILAMCLAPRGSSRSARSGAAASAAVAAGAEAVTTPAAIRPPVSTAPRTCRACGSRLRYRQGVALACFACKRMPSEVLF